MKISDEGVYNLAIAILDQAVYDYKKTKYDGCFWDNNMRVFRAEVQSFLRSDYAEFLAETVGINRFSNWVREEVTT